MQRDFRNAELVCLDVHRSYTHALPDKKLEPSIRKINQLEEVLVDLGTNRLYLGNLTPYGNEEELVELFPPYDEITEVFMNMKKDYAFNAEKVKRKNCILKIRFAPNATALRVSNLGPFDTNELLYRVFDVDSIVGFKNRPSATAALKYCSEKYFVLNSSLRLCFGESYTY
ncbi:no-on-transient A [Culex quinquefasciatus]|uniref:No-on-transient A n=1 Tax=Culex quinquefasciatus TaxID=7176 RepID=B0XJZ1_CULQU|nr:no-on-transient A [Culex quinquefasciatus]|eukprot:XP_001869963.1 no-on-transient A [Culex quinquefasciatus]